MVIVIRDAALPVQVAYASRGPETVIRMRADLITEEGARALADVLSEARCKYFPMPPQIGQPEVKAS